MKNSEKISLSLKNTSGNKLSEQELALRSKAVFQVWTFIDVVNFIETNFDYEEFIDLRLSNLKSNLLNIEKNLFKIGRAHV